MRARDLNRFTAAPYDLLVIGGGIYGLAIAYEAGSRGLRTALVEAGDFGGATSFNHQKTAHGGLRALQSARIDRAIQSIRERRALARIAPWLLRPLPFLVGTYRSWTRNRGAQWYDYQIVEADRLTFAFAEAADRSGVDLANYAEAIGPVRDGGRISGMEVRDALTGGAFKVSAR